MEGDNVRPAAVAYPADTKSSDDTCDVLIIKKERSSPTRGLFIQNSRIVTSLRKTQEEPAYQHPGIVLSGRLTHGDDAL
jgi:hypothetical protein